MNSFKEMKERMEGLLVLIVMIGLFISLGMFAQNRRDSSEPWVGTITTSENNSDSVIASDRFKSLEECRAWANDYSTKNMLSEGNWDYSCGTNCTYSTQTYSNAQKVDVYECETIEQ